MSRPTKMRDNLAGSLEAEEDDGTNGSEHN